PAAHEPHLQHFWRGRRRCAVLPRLTGKFPERGAGKKPRPYGCTRRGSSRARRRREPAVPPPFVAGRSHDCRRFIVCLSPQSCGGESPVALFTPRKSRRKPPPPAG